MIILASKRVPECLGSSAKIVNFRGPPLLNTITQGGFTGGGGGKSIHTIIAKGFSYPHTEFGARRSRRLAVKFASN